MLCLAIVTMHDGGLALPIPQMRKRGSRKVSQLSGPLVVGAGARIPSQPPLPTLPSLACVVSTLNQQGAE